ncbi:nuclear exosome regulator NRDE2-like [Asterias amurensis]|uniref:nuclear exosome regulator NRDE2-like n=1 Tax=Asterias amurensis TaxID=7602 RepID=UPI003AB71C93
MSRKPLFPSANTRLDQVRDAISPSAAESLLEINDTTKVSLISTGVVQSTSSEIQQIDNLDWLTNQSFRSDDAITIAKQHAVKTDEYDREAVRQVSSLHQKHKAEESNSSEDSSQDNNTESNSKSSIAQLEKDHHKSRSISHHSHKKSKKHKHKRDYEYSSDDRKQKQSHHRDRHHRDKKKKSHRKKKRRRDDSSSSSSDERNSVANSTHGSEKTVPAIEEFCIDVKANRNNLCFDSLHFTDTVAYHRLGHSCLGLDKRRQNVTWKDVKPKKKQKEGSMGFRYFTSAPLEVNEDAVDTGANPGATNPLRLHSTNDSLSYIPIVDPGSSRAKPECDPLGVYDQSTRAYLQPSTTLNPSFLPLVKSETSTSPATHTTAHYNRHLHDNPLDVHMWLEFVRFQDSTEYDKLVPTGSNQSQQDSDSSKMSSNRRRTAKLIAERKLAILDKALLRNPNSVPLHLEQLKIGKELWDVSEQMKQWERLLRLNPDDVFLCKEYLLFHQTCFSRFSVSKVAGLYGKCFTALTSRLAELDEDETSDMEKHLLDLFVGLCHFWRQSGHTEKAVAAYQAMIELNCFCPSDIQQDTHLEGQVAFLETFWDSSKPRFGEKEAKGWANWMQKKSRGGWEEVKMPQVSEVDDEPSSPTATLTDIPLWQAWVQEEISREAQQFAPWSPDETKGETEDDCEDPERMVLFDDISQVLFRLTSHQEKQFQLVCHFLEFLDVSVPPCLVGKEGSDTLQLYLDQPSQILSSVKTSVGVGKLPSGCSGIASNCRSLEQMTNATSVKLIVEDASMDYRILEDFVEEVFQQITPVFHEPACTQLLLMRLDCRMQRALIAKDKKQQRKKVKEAKRFAKKLLSQEENRNNLDLWASLARWEGTMGNTEEAQRVLQTALRFCGQPQTKRDKQAATRLVQTFTELFLCFQSKSSNVVVGQENNVEVLNVLTTLGEGMAYIPLKDIPSQSVSSVRLLKARRNYQETITEVLATYSRSDSQDTDAAERMKWLIPSGTHAVHLTLCFAIFQYLTVGMQAASVVFESSLSSLKKGKLTDNFIVQQLRLDQELITEAYVGLLSAHVYSNPTPLGSLRNLLKISMDDFPTNPTLLEAFIISESKSHIAGRVRRYFDRVTRQKDSLVQWLFAIRAEMLRQEALVTYAAAGMETVHGQQNEVPMSETGISNRIRSLFQRATESQTARHCVLLWRMYMQFEMQQGNPKRAEAIFYSALQHCPWAKVLYVDAVRHQPLKLQDCQDLLIEKELHIRAPLEEVELLMKSRPS